VLCEVVSDNIRFVEPGVVENKYIFLATIKSRNVVAQEVFEGQAVL
jgi:hypothetical protein